MPNRNFVHSLFSLSTAHKNSKFGIIIIRFAVVYPSSFLESLTQVGAANRITTNAPINANHSLWYASQPREQPAPTIAMNRRRKIPIFFNASITVRI